MARLRRRVHVCRHCQAGKLAVRYQWPKGTVLTWYFSEHTTPPGLSPTAVREEIRRATAAWSAVCGVVFQEVDRPDDVRIHIYFTPIDGRWNVLAQAELPVGIATAHNTLELDPAELWDLEMLFEVILHELGHSMGIEHSPPTVASVMAAIFARGNRKLTAWDLNEAVLRFGPARAAPAPPFNPAHRELTISFSVDRLGAWEIVGAIDLVSGMLVNPALHFKG